MDEIITWRVLIIISYNLIGIYIFKKNNKGIKKIWEQSQSKQVFYQFLL